MYCVYCVLCDENICVCDHLNRTKRKIYSSFIIAYYYGYCFIYIRVIVIVSLCVSLDLRSNSSQISGLLNLLIVMI